MADKMLYCDWCGAELGLGQKWPGELESCGDSDCNREVRSMEQGERENARLDAEEDDFSRYR